MVHSLPINESTISYSSESQEHFNNANAEEESLLPLREFDFPGTRPVIAESYASSLRERDADGNNIIFEVEDLANIATTAAGSIDSQDRPEASNDSTNEEQLLPACTITSFKNKHKIPILQDTPGSSQSLCHYDDQRQACDNRRDSSLDANTMSDEDHDGHVKNNGENTNDKKNSQLGAPTVLSRNKLSIFTAKNDHQPRCSASAPASLSCSAAFEEKSSKQTQSRNHTDNEQTGTTTDDDGSITDNNAPHCEKKPDEDNHGKQEEQDIIMESLKVARSQSRQERKEIDIIKEATSDDDDLEIEICECPVEHVNFRNESKANIERQQSRPWQQSNAEAVLKEIDETALVREWESLADTHFDYTLTLEDKKRFINVLCAAVDITEAFMAEPGHQQEHFTNNTQTPQPQQGPFLTSTYWEELHQNDSSVAKLKESPFVPALLRHYACPLKIFNLPYNIRYKQIQNYFFSPNVLYIKHLRSLGCAYVIYKDYAEMFKAYNEKNRTPIDRNVIFCRPSDFYEMEYDYFIDSQGKKNVCNTRQAYNHYYNSHYMSSTTNNKRKPKDAFMHYRPEPSITTAREPTSTAQYHHGYHIQHSSIMVGHWSSYSNGSYYYQRNLRENVHEAKPTICPRPQAMIKYWRRLLLSSPINYLWIRLPHKSDVDFVLDLGYLYIPKRNVKKFNAIFNSSQQLILIFNLPSEQGRAEIMQGCAKMTSEIIDMYNLPKRLVAETPFKDIPTLKRSHWRYVCRMEWITKLQLPLTCVFDLKNKWNHSKPLGLSQNGVLVDPELGAHIVNMFDADRIQ